jgi:hypothetical protein
MKHFTTTIIWLAFFSLSVQASGGFQPGSLTLYFSDQPVKRYGMQLQQGADSPDNVLTPYGGVGFFVADQFSTSLYGELEIGVRMALPQRISPFVGLGSTLFGYSSKKINEEDSKSRFFVSVIPEVGINFWITDYFRITTIARYYITSLGRSEDFWAYGIGLGIR